MGHLYSAEALVLLDKISEAQEHLKPDLIQDISIEFPAEEDIEIQAIKTNPPSSKYIFVYFDRRIK